MRIKTTMRLLLPMLMALFLAKKLMVLPLNPSPAKAMETMLFVMALARMQQD